MLVVKVELWPGGSKDAAKEIAQMQIWNESNLADVSDYGATIEEAGTPRLGIPARQLRVKTKRFYRNQSVWALIKRILDENVEEKQEDV